MFLKPLLPHCQASSLYLSSMSLTIGRRYNKLNNINELSLYIVKNNEINLFFNKRYNLVYGKYLKHFLDTS
jgi:hypothetical protein